MSFSPVVAYFVLLAQAFEMRQRGEDESEILDRMDFLWFSLSAEDIAQVNSIGARIASGELTEMQFIDQVRSAFASSFFSAKASGSVSPEFAYA